MTNQHYFNGGGGLRKVTLSTLHKAAERGRV